MRPLLWAFLGLAVAGCGPIQGLDPLGGLGGAVDTARYSFEDGLQGWEKAAANDGGSCISVFHAPGRSIYGQASLALQLLGMGNHYPANLSCPGVDNAGRAIINLSAMPPDLTGKTISAWVYLPSNGQASTDAPTQAQLYLVDATADSYGNGPGVNLLPDLWTRITFKPVAWAGPGDYDQDGIFLAAGFDPSAIIRLGVKISASGAAPCAFSFDGIVLIDSVDW